MGAGVVGVTVLVVNRVGVGNFTGFCSVIRRLLQLVCVGGWYRGGCGLFALIGDSMKTTILGLGVGLFGVVFQGAHLLGVGQGALLGPVGNVVVLSRGDGGRFADVAGSGIGLLSRGNLAGLRRLSLAVTGALPSLHDVREFEGDCGEDRWLRTVRSLLADRRCSDYLAERLSRVLVGADDGQFIVFRRDRFNAWLANCLRLDLGYDEIVRQMVGAEGLWTDRPESNFVTSAFANDDLDENRLAARSARAFLGQSMDCAQCHDHFFAEWKQHHFAGIASFFARTDVALGVNDRGLVGEGSDEETKSVPFHSEWISPSDRRPRERFAEWLTHRENRRFERSIANRVWGLMFGRPYISPVDDMPNPPSERDVLDELGQDFRLKNCSIKRLIETIACSEIFLSESAGEVVDEGSAVQEWSRFPVTRLRPEQIIGSMLQATSAQSIDQESHLFVRAIRYFRERDFVEAYGDLGDQELVDRAGTIPQALLRMNGRLTRESIEAGPLSSVNRIARHCSSNESAVEACFLACITRRPTPAEAAHFVELLGNSTGSSRVELVEDIFWALFNSPEFSWNH